MGSVCSSSGSIDAQVGVEGEAIRDDSRPMPSPCSGVAKCYCKVEVGVDQELHVVIMYPWLEHSPYVVLCTIKCCVLSTIGCPRVYVVVV